MLLLKYGKTYPVCLGEAKPIEAIYIGKIYSKRTRNVYKFLARDSNENPIVYSTNFDHVISPDEVIKQGILTIQRFVPKKPNKLEGKVANEILKRNNL